MKDEDFQTGVAAFCIFAFLSCLLGGVSATLFKMEGWAYTLPAFVIAGVAIVLAITCILMLGGYLWRVRDARRAASTSIRLVR